MPAMNVRVYQDHQWRAMGGDNMTQLPQKLSLQMFDLLDLQQFTLEGSYSKTASKDFHVFYVGRDNVHGVLEYLLSRITQSLYLSMFGYDDDRNNDLVMAKVADPTVTVLITLDKSQAGGAHEKKLLDSDAAKDPVGFNSHFTIGQSLTHQICHTKGAVLDGKVGFEGSTNWSDSGEGTFVLSSKPGGVGYKAQNNTLAVFTCPDAVAHFQTELIAEHMIAQQQQKAKAGTP